MSNYRHILVGLDLSQESQQVVDRVKQLVDSSETKLSLLHVQEPLSFAYGGDMPMDLSDIQDQIQTRACKSLENIGRELSVDKSDQHVIIGQPAHEIHRFSKDNDVDLIIVGTHARHGLNLIFGSTANGVLHGACCDVLAIKIQS